MSHHIIEAKDLHFRYPDGTVGLENVSFRITHGESVAIVGENGAGKSTFLLHLNGYLTPQSGTLQVGGFPVIRKNLNTVRRTIGTVFQNPDDQLFMATVFDDVAFGPLNLGLEDEDAEKATVKALDTVGMRHLADRPPYRLSQGEKRAVSIATVLAMSPDILVMDEPAASLDPKSRMRLMELLKTFRHTKIIASHDLDMVLELCGRTILLYRGIVAADGPTEKILSDRDLLEKHNLLVPFRLR
jgi:cobalt/nickel transport system ATP-binding protein